MIRKIVVLFFACFAMPAIAADQCSDVIKLSLVSTSEFRSQEQFERDAREFCSSYSKNQGSSNSAGANVGYAGFSFGGTSASTNAKSIAETICRSSDTSSMRDDAYDKLIQTIAPQAYDSYNRCVNSDSSFSVEVGAGATPVYAPLFISFTPQTAGEYAVIKVASDQTVNCDLQEDTRMDAAGRIFVACTRNDPTLSVGSINVINLAGGGENLSIPWTQYNDNGVPVDLAAEFLDATAAMNRMRENMNTMVVAFESKSCPAGFTAYEPAQGRFIRGIDPAGTNDTVREPGSVQGDQLKTHSHQLTVYGGTHRASREGNDRESVPQANTARQDSTTSFGGNETRPKNVALLYCQFSA